MINLKGAIITLTQTMEKLKKNSLVTGTLESSNIIIKKEGNKNG